MSAPERQPERTPRRRREVPEFTLIETICRGVRGHGVEVVQTTSGPRRYHVTYEKGTFEEPRLANYFFDTIAEVLDNHERVMQSKLGMLARFPSGRELRIAGGTQEMSSLADRIATLAGSHIALATYEESSRLKDEIAATEMELGNVRNPYKVAAKQELGIAVGTSDPALQLDALLAGGLDISHKASEDLRIAQGVLARWRLVFAKRRTWEGIINRRYDELGEELERLRTGGLTSDAREQAARHISGPQEGVLAQLNKIEGPEYWQRIQDRDVQRLADSGFGAHIRAGNDRMAIKILEDAISKLWRVGEERTKRERGEKEK